MKPCKRRLALILALVLALSLGVVPITASAAATTVFEDFETNPYILTEISYGSYGEADNSAGAEYYDETYGYVCKMYLDGNSDTTYNRVKCSTGETSAYVFGSDTVELTADILVSGSDGGTSSSDTRYAAIVAIISGKKIRLEFNYDDGKIYFGKSPSPGLVELGTFSVDTWYNVRMVLDTAAETCDVYIDGTLLGNDLNNLISTTDTTPLLTLSLNDNTDNTSDLKSTCYVDNILITDAIYTVGFDSQGGSTLSDVTDVKYDTKITAPDDPTRAGYTFDGWHTDTTYTTPWDFANGTVTEDMTLYAKWTASEWWIDYRADSFSDEDTIAKTINITSPEELSLFAYNVINGTNYSGFTITLANDIDLTDHYWTPIGLYSTDNAFSGTFDGAGYTISGMKVDTAEERYVGLFGYAVSATIKNVSVSGTVDAVVGSTPTYVNGVPLHVGGILGRGMTRIDMSNCHSSVNVKGVQELGNAVYAGGLVGGINVSSSSVIKNCFATGDVTVEQQSATVGSIGAYYDAGGLFGAITGNVTVSNSYSTGNVVVTAAYSASSTSTAPGNLAGGFIGAIRSGTIIENCYSSGTVSSTAANGKNEAGAFVGRISDVADTIIDSYYLYNAYAADTDGYGTNSGTIGSLTGLTAAQLANDDAISSTYTTGISGHADIGTLVVDALNSEATDNGWEAWIDGGINPIFAYLATYTVTFDSQSGSAVDPITDVSNGATITAPTDPTRSGYTFAGWYTDTDFTTAWDFSTDTVTSDMTLYAKWATIPIIGSTYSVTLTKVDADSSTTYLSGATFRLYNSNGALIGSYTTDSTGKFTVSGLYNASYYFVETAAPSGYELDAGRHAFTISYADKAITITNTKSSADTPSALNSTDHFKYVTGNTDGMVRPNDNVTRAEVATMFYRLLTTSRRDTIFTSTNSFSDVTADLWYNKAVSSMAAGGYVTGYPDGSFSGGKAITRAEFVAIASRFIGERSQTVSFTDVPTTYWAYQDISTAVYFDWIEGYSDSTFRPDQPITRAEAMTIINRILHRGVEADGVISGFKDWPDNDSSAWYYYEVIEATNDHEYTGTRPSEQWTSLTTDYTYDISYYEKP